MPGQAPAKVIFEIRPVIPTKRNPAPRPPRWLPYAIIAAVCWGLWGVLAKGPSKELSGWMTQVLFTLALLPTGLVALRSKSKSSATNRWRGLLWGLGAGLAAASGDLCFYLALQSGADTSIVVPLVSLYPVVTISIAFCCLRERIQLIQVAGVIVALFAITLLTRGTLKMDSPEAAWASLTASPWVIYTLAALSLAGLFTAAQKLSTAHISAELSHLACVGGFVLVALFVVATKPLNWNMAPSTLCSALAAGLLNGFGIIAAFVAYRRGGKAAIVAPLTATVQPLVTVILARVFLEEHFGVPEGWGIVFAICAAVLLSQEHPRPSSYSLADPRRIG
jgi:uncharacterized membrane protein